MFPDEAQAHSALQMWAEYLKPFTDAQIEKAVAAAIARYPSFPPTLGEFIALAREYEDFTPEYYHAKPHTPASPEVKRAVADMMSKLKADLEAGQP